MSWAASGLLALMFFAAPHQAASSNERHISPIVEGRLAGTTVLAGGSPAKIRMALPAPATIENPLVTGAGLTVEGKGRFVGFALVEVTGKKPRTSLIGGRLPLSAGRRNFVLNASFFADPTRPSYELDKGIYDLYLLPGGSHAKVTLRLEGVTGRGLIRPMDPVDIKVQALKPLETKVGDNVRSGAGMGQISEDGLLFQAAWFTSGTHLGSNYDACLWKGRAPEPWATMPKCGDSAAYESPGGRAAHGTIDYGTSVGEDFRLYYGAWVASEVAARGGAFGQSFALQTASAVESIDSLGIWLNF